MNKILERIGQTGIVPVVVINNAKDARPLARALCEGGVMCAEITFRTEAAEESVRRISEEFPEMLVGAGTVLTIGQVDRAIAAGAKFIVSPGLNPKIVRYCVEHERLILPGCTNPSDIEQALEYGLDVVKFFPAEAAGGLPMIQALAAPYVGMKFMPTGGIGPDNVRKYLAYDRILACGGSWMVKSELVDSHRFDEIERLAHECAQIVKESRRMEGE